MLARFESCVIINGNGIRDEYCWFGNRMVVRQGAPWNPIILYETVLRCAVFVGKFLGKAGSIWNISQKNMRIWQRRY